MDTVRLGNSTQKQLINEALENQRNVLNATAQSALNMQRQAAKKHEEDRLRVDFRQKERERLSEEKRLMQHVTQVDKTVYMIGGVIALILLFFVYFVILPVFGSNRNKIFWALVAVTVVAFILNITTWHSEGGTFAQIGAYQFK